MWGFYGFGRDSVSLLRCSVCFVTGFSVLFLNMTSFRGESLRQGLEFGVHLFEVLGLASSLPDYPFRVSMPLCKALGLESTVQRKPEPPDSLMWEFPKVGGTLFWGPYFKDPTI